MKALKDFYIFYRLFRSFFYIDIDLKWKNVLNHLDFINFALKIISLQFLHIQILNCNRQYPISSSSKSLESLFICHVFKKTITPLCSARR